MQVNESGGNFEELIKLNDASKTALERAMVKFLDDYVVLDKATNQMVRPKAKTMDHLLSMLKSGLSEITKYNFGDKVAFRGLFNAASTIQKDIKEVGR